MNLFCILWTPLFYLFWSSLNRRHCRGGVWALILGSAAAMTRFFLGSFVEPGGFGLSRWISACADYVAAPVILPIVVYLLLVLFRAFPPAPDFSGFILLWLIPAGAIQSLSWNVWGDPVFLVLIPLLWTSMAAGIPFFVRLIHDKPRWWTAVPGSLAILALPLLAVTSWWAFYGQKPGWGIPLLAASLLPMVTATVLHLTTDHTDNTGSRFPK